MYFTPVPKHVYWYYGEVPPHPTLPGVTYRRGLPTDTEVEDDLHLSVVVLDDLMWEARSSMTVANLFTRVAHHRQCFIIHITQNLFQAGRVTRTQSLNAHYLVLFKNPRDRQQVMHLARQIYPRNVNFVLTSFEDATSQREHGYLLVDLNTTTKEELRLRTNILIEDKQSVHQIVYVPSE